MLPTFNSARFHKYADHGGKCLVHDVLFYRRACAVPFPVAVPREARVGPYVSHKSWLEDRRATALGRLSGRRGYSPRAKGIIETGRQEARECVEGQPIKRRKMARKQRIEEWRSEALAILQAVQQASRSCRIASTTSLL